MGWRKKSSRSKTSWVKKAVTGLSSSLDQFENNTARSSRTERYGQYGTYEEVRMCVRNGGRRRRCEEDAGMGTLNALSIFDALS